MVLTNRRDCCASAAVGVGVALLNPTRLARGMEHDLEDRSGKIMGTRWPRKICRSGGVVGETLEALLVRRGVQSSECLQPLSGDLC